MKLKYIHTFFLLLLCFVSKSYSQIDAVNDNYYLRVNVCPAILTLRFNDDINLGSTKILGLRGTLPNDNIVIDTYNITLNYCWTGPYVKSRSFTYILFEDTSGTGVSGYIDSAIVSIDFANIDSIYPGDFNKDGIVNNLDLLGMAQGFGKIGKYRIGGGSPSFIDQYGQDWDSITQTAYFNQNAKHADFDGNGRVDSIDYFVFNQNYSKRYKSPAPVIPSPPGYILSIQNTSASDTVLDGNSISLRFILSDTSNPIPDICGLAYSLLYDTTCIAPYTGDTTFNIPYNTSTNFFIDPAQHVSITKHTRGTPRIETAVSNIKKISGSGSGSVGSIIVVLDDYIDGNIKVPGIYPLTFTITDIMAITSTGARINISGSEYSFYYKKLNVGYDMPACKQLNIYPNPTNDKLYISNTCDEMEEIIMYNTLGTVVYQSAATNSISVNSFTSGIYTMLIKGSETMSRVKIIIP